MMNELREESLKQILWLASFPKSGNTWLRCILDSYAVDAEVDINDSCNRYTTGDLSEPAYQSVCPFPLTRAPLFVWSACRPAALMMLLAHRDYRPTAVKTHHANVPIGGITLAPPDITSAAVLIVRDPRDVVISWSHHADMSIDNSIAMLLNEEGGIKHKSNVLGHYTHGWPKHCRSWLDHDDFTTLVIRYEDMLEDTVGEVRKVIPLTPYELDEDRLKRAVERCEFQKLRAKEDQDGFQEAKHGRFFREGRSGQWVDQLTKGQIYRIEEACWKEMVELGYELVNESLADVTTREPVRGGASLQGDGDD